MDVIDHAGRPPETWRPGVLTRMRVSARVGAHQLCIFEQFCDPGLGAPRHVHAVEEVLEVIEGVAEIFVGDARRRVEPDQSVVIPAGAWHGFTNVGAGALRVRATLAAPIFEATYDDGRELSRRYLPG